MSLSMLQISDGHCSGCAAWLDSLTIAVIAVRCHDIITILDAPTAGTPGDLTFAIFGDSLVFPLVFHAHLVVVEMSVNPHVGH